MKGRRTFLSLLAVIMLSFLLIPPVLAAEDGIVHYKKTVIPEHEKIENVIVLGSDATISGEVTTAVIVINGNLQINKTAKIKGPVLVLGGKINQQQGADVSEHIISLNFNNQTQNSFILGGILFLSSWIIRLILSMITILLTVLASLFIRKRITQIPEYITKKTGKVIITGFIISFALFALSVLLTIVIIGIPIVILIILGIFISFFLGMAYLSHRIGEGIKVIDEKTDWIKILVGSIVLVSMMNLPLFGGIILFLITCYTLGFVITWMYQRFSLRKNNK
ncbi:hypothetical protein ACQKP0_20720 [Heyndrickxia sp. NPDC080065]|uniref:hypothetical protein n=1 Tax=Heyndrickxia sp. NPDC080065 TaxID=3390568 RepID=UPI003D08B09C